MSRSYSELITLKTFEERFEYLRMHGSVGRDTFGYDRYINQILYRSKEWRQLRPRIIIRDEGCDLGILTRPINDSLVIHHMNLISPEILLENMSMALDPEFLITTHWLTHKAIHYGDINLLPKPLIERKPDDTLLWKRIHR